MKRPQDSSRDELTENPILDASRILTSLSRNGAQSCRSDHGSGTAYRGIKGWGALRTPKGGVEEESEAEEEEDD